MRSDRVLVATAALCVALALAGGCGEDRTEPPERRHDPVVADGFFGINGQGLLPLAVHGELQPLDEHLDLIAAGGVDFIRTDLNWPQLEPAPPAGGRHRYELAGLDSWIRAIAEHGLSWAPAILGIPTPAWAADPRSAQSCGARAEPRRAADVAALAAAIARRYGRNGAFWRENPDLAPLPVTSYELWNEPNLGSFWCPVPDPEAYARLAAVSAGEIRELDPDATLILGGLAWAPRTVIEPDRAQVAPREFLTRMLSARPGLARTLDVVGVHAYAQRPEGVLRALAGQRRAVDRTALAGKPLAFNETGWYTAGVAPRPPVSEQERATYLGAVANAVARSNCGISSFAPHTWITREADVTNIEEWYGIAEPESAEPRPAAEAYLSQVLLFEGRAEPAPPTAQSEIC